MIVHFGLHFDGMQPTSTRTVVGETVLGPARLLDLLELRLGLPPPRARPAEALLAYQRCLVELDDARRFYHRSFAVDALGVARTLLDWRAQWHEAGWSGRFAGAVSKRLADMAELERLTPERVPLTDGQRLQRIAAALDHGLDAHVDKIVLHDEIDELPVTWQRVLAHLKVESTTRAQTHPTSAHAHAQTPVHTTPTQSPTNARRAEALTESRSARP